MKIIFLCNRQTYLTKMSRIRFHGIKALEKIATVKYSGLNWENYNSNLTVQQNLDNMQDNFDICIAYKPLELKNFKDINIPKCIRYNEMYDVKLTLEEIKESGSQLVICHHLNDCEKYKRMGLPNVKFVYIGHGAEKTIFKNYNTPKEYDILVAGAITKKDYPLRYRFLQLLPRLKKKYRCHQSTHPGYKLNDAHTDRYLKEYASKINKSKITLACTSTYKYRLGKYVEIPMCGSAALCGDIPYDNVDEYSFIIEVNNAMSDDEIIEKISYYLDNENERLKKVELGKNFASHYTQEYYAEKLLANIVLFLENTIKKEKLLECKLPNGRTLREKLNMKRRNTELHKYINTFLSEIKNVSDKKNKYIIDLGPGPGDFLEISRNLGFKIKGYDAKLDSIKGMGMDYVNLCAMYAKEKNIPIEYCNFEETGFSGIEDDSVYLINSRGSFEQIFSKYLLGIPHYKTHLCNQEWSHTEEMYHRFKTFFSNCSKKLIKNGIVFIAFNGTKCNSLHDIINKLLPDTLRIQKSDPQILKLIKVN